jgi:hypothetical protein
MIALTFLSTALARLDFISETLPGMGHVLVGVLAFYYAIASLIHAFTGEGLIPLGPPLLHRKVLRPTRVA